MDVDTKIFLSLFEKYLKLNFSSIKSAQLAKEEYSFFEKEHKKLLEKYDDNNN